MKPLIFSMALMMAWIASARDTDLLQEQVSQREDLRLLQEKIGQLQTDLRALKSDHESLNTTVSRLKTDLSDLHQSREQFQKDVERLDGLIRKLDAAREQDRKTIVEEVGREISHLSEKNKPKPSSSGKPSKSQAQEGVEHTVEKGQTLTAIAEAYGVPKKAIMEANHLTSAELKAGQKLFIPQEGKGGQVPTAGRGRQP